MVDERDVRGGDKVWQWVKKGVPLRLEIGPRDMDEGLACSSARRDRAPKDKQSVPRAEFVATIGSDARQSIQDGLLDARAGVSRRSTRAAIDTKDEFYAFFTSEREEDGEAPTPIHGGFALTHFGGDVELEKKIKDELGVTVRCIPLEQERARHLPVHRQAERAARRLGEGLLNA